MVHIYTGEGSHSSARAVSAGTGKRQFSPAEAARVCHVSIDTIRRRLRTGAFLGAERQGNDDWSPWLIPASSLVEARLCSEAELEEAGRATHDPVELVAQMVVAEAELTSERARREAAEARLSQSMAEVEYLRRLLDRLLIQPPDLLDRRGA